MLYFFSNNCALVGENVSCYYLSRRIAIVLLPVAAQSDGQSSTIAGYHGLSLAAAAGTGLSLSTRQAATQFGLSSSTTAAALSTNRHNWSSSSINRAQCSVVRSQCPEMLLNKIEKTFNNTYTGLKNFLQRFQICFSQNPSCKGMESTS